MSTFFVEVTQWEDEGFAHEECLFLTKRGEVDNVQTSCGMQARVMKHLKDECCLC